MRVGKDDESDELTGRIIACALAVHRAIGPGMLESAYQKCLAIEFAATGRRFEERVRWTWCTAMS
jgi:GxxExxY protein